MAESEWFWFTKLIVQSISTLLLIALCIFHGYNTLRDYHIRKIMSPHTENSKKSIKLATTFTFISILLFTLSAAIVVIKQLSFILSYCWIIDAVATLTFALAKLFLFLVLLLKLHIVYSSSMYEYNVVTLKIIAIVIIIYDIIFCFYYVATHRVNPYKYNIHSMAINCNPTYNMIVFGGFTLLSVICSIAFMISFIRPLKKLSKLSDSSNNDLMKTGYKVSILVSSTFISTYVLMILAILSSIGVLYSSLDIIINVVCLMLMTKYYNNNKYFETICCFCWSMIPKLKTNTTSISRSNSTNGASANSNSKINSKSKEPTCDIEIVTS